MKEDASRPLSYVPFCFSGNTEFRGISEFIIFDCKKLILRRKKNISGDLIRVKKRILALAVSFFYPPCPFLQQGIHVNVIC